LSTKVSFKQNTIQSMICFLRTLVSHWNPCIKIINISLLQYWNIVWKNIVCDMGLQIFSFKGNESADWKLLLMCFYHDQGRESCWNFEKRIVNTFFFKVMGSYTFLLNICTLNICCRILQNRKKKSVTSSKLSIKY